MTPLARVLWKPEWNELLGKEPDTALAAKLGMHKLTVGEHRRALGIGRFISHAARAPDRRGMRFGKWVVGPFIRKIGRGQTPVYECTCDCGNSREIPFWNLRSGRSTGCTECQHAQITKYRVGDIVGEGQRVVAASHGVYGDRFRRRIVKLRCESSGFTRNHVVSGLVKAGCRKCSPKPRSGKTGRLFTVNGETHNMAGWARKLGITREAVRIRIKHGWKIEDALTKARAA